MKNDSLRNPFATLAKKRKAGKIRSRKEKRQNGKNIQRELLKQAADQD